MARLLLVRHGETELGHASRYGGQRETPLTPLGERQHERLLELLRGAAIGRVVASDLACCRLLAESIAADHGLQAEADAALREASFGVWEGLTYQEAMARDRAAMVAFNRDTANVAPPGGESLAAVATRAHACLETLLREHRRRDDALLIVSHGGTVQALLCGLLALPLERYWTLRVDPASLTALDTYPMGAIVATLNDTCHLSGLGSD